MVYNLIYFSNYSHNIWLNRLNRLNEKLIYGRQINLNGILWYTIYNSSNLLVVMSKVGLNSTHDNHDHNHHKTVVDPIYVKIKWIKTKNVHLYKLLRIHNNLRHYQMFHKLNNTCTQYTANDIFQPKLSYLQ